MTSLPLAAAEAALLKEIRRSKRKTYKYSYGNGMHLSEFIRVKIQAESDEYIRGVERALAIVKEIQQ